jgi:hypothetical protein
MVTRQNDGWHWLQSGKPMAQSLGEGAMSKCFASQQIMQLSILADLEPFVIGHCERLRVHFLISSNM